MADSVTQARPMDKATFERHEGEKARQIAQELGFVLLTPEQIKSRMAAYPLQAVRLASVRWSCTGKRSRQAVITEVLQNLQNPHVNHGDDLATALGHIEDKCRWLERYGYLPARRPA